MSNNITVNLTPTVQPDIIGDIEKGNGQSITSSSIAPQKGTTKGQALLAQAAVDGVKAHPLAAQYNEADKSWTIEFDGVDTPENYQSIINRLTIQDNVGMGGQTAEMVIRLEDTANNGPAANSKVTTLKTTVNLSFQSLVDDAIIIPTQKVAMLADGIADNAPQIALTGVMEVGHAVAALHTL